MLFCHHLVLPLSVWWYHRIVIFHLHPQIPGKACTALHWRESQRGAQKFYKISHSGGQVGTPPGGVVIMNIEYIYLSVKL